jgi:hypothetical protein
MDGGPSISWNWILSVGFFLSFRSSLLEKRVGGSSGCTEVHSPLMIVRNGDEVPDRRAHPPVGGYYTTRTVTLSFLVVGKYIRTIFAQGGSGNATAERSFTTSGSTLLLDRWLLFFTVLNFSAGRYCSFLATVPTSRWEMYSLIKD